jgi:acyl dehydratase
VDAERAASGPYGKTISHGYLTLSLVPALVKDVYKVEGVRMAINYGLNKVRFLAPVPVGSRVRARVELLSTTASGQGVQANYRVTVELEGSERPALTAETIGLLIPDTTA